VGPLLGLFFGPEAPTDFDSAKAVCENGVYERFFHGMLAEGVALAPGAYEALFPSLAHGSDEVAATIDAVRRVAAIL
jgi:glutamate-1-semialdehyde 2,1-aminomutase